MASSRMRNSFRNIFFGLINISVSLLFPFITRTIILKFLGPNYLGLNSLFTSVIGVLSLAELGIGNAIVYSMYRPIAEDDKDKVCCLLGFYQKVYRIIGSIILVVGLCILPFIDLIIANDIPSDVNIHILFFIQLINIVISYWLFAYKASLLSAYQREDINSKINVIITTISFILQILVLVYTKNYYYYLILTPIFTIISNILKKIYVDNIFPELKCKDGLDKQVIGKIKEKTIALVYHKIGGIIANFFDNIVISAFLGLTAIAIYNNYYFIYLALVKILSVIYSSITASVGNSLVVESRNDNFKKFTDMNFLNNIIVGWASVFMLCLYQPVMFLWVGKDMMLDFKTVILFVIYFYINMARRMVTTFRDSAGLWKYNKYMPFISGLVNVAINVILIQIINIDGVILSTIISFMIIETPWDAWIVVKKYFDRDLVKYLLNQLKYALFFGVVASICYGISIVYDVNIYQSIIIRVCICTFIPLLFFVVIFKDKIKILYEYLSVLKKYRGKKNE